MRSGIISLAVEFPKTCRTNEYWRKRHPEMVAGAEQRALSRVWARSSAGERTAFERAMEPYLDDPFRGTRQRRVLMPNERAVSALEAPVARAAIGAAGLVAADIDLMIVSAFPSDQPGIGDAAFLAGELGLTGAAWNLETACSSALVAFRTACALVDANQYRNVLVVTCCLYSRVTEVTDSLAWTIGDAAAAFVVAARSTAVAIEGFHTVNTAETCGAISYQLEGRGEEAVMRMRVNRETGYRLRDSAERTVSVCVDEALADAGLSLADIDRFVCNTPTAWFAEFFARKLGIDPNMVTDPHPMYANIGPALWPTALHYAVSAGDVTAGQRVLLFSVGSVASAAAAVVTWGEIGLGPAPAPPANYE